VHRVQQQQRNRGKGSRRVVDHLLGWKRARLKVV
jgi:hypothetical protein